MTNVKQKNEVYRCNVCGNMFEVVYVGGGEPSCCNQIMELLTEKTRADEGKEKHVPVIEGNKVKVGSVPHPMEEAHYIKWIEIIVDAKVYKKFLNPGDAPETDFSAPDGEVTARAFCNIHGLWRS